MNDEQQWGASTIAIRTGHTPSPEGEHSEPIYPTSSFVFNSAAEAAARFSGDEPGNIYSRFTNPTVRAFEERLAAMEGGESCVATASGMAAILAVCLGLLNKGDHIVSSRSVFGTTTVLLTNYLPRFGIETTFVDLDDPHAWESAIQSNTRLLFLETPSNPLAQLGDITRLADIAHKHDALLVVDNCFCTPVLQRPLSLGADIVIHSLTKYIGGHGTTIGGVIVDSGKFDWAGNAERFPMLNEPDPSYHGVVYTEALGPAAYIGRCRVVPLRNTGAALAPHSAFLILQGLETLGLRMERHCENALKVAQHLQDHDKVEWVRYAALEDSEYYDNCQRITAGQASGILSFGIKGGKEAGARFIDALQMILRLVNIGDAKSLACHPATTTHRQLNAEELATAGVSEDLVRISVGIEHADDIIADIDQALEQV